MLKSQLLMLLQQEIRHYDFSYFIDQPPSMVQGGRGVCVPGCPVCKVRINYDAAIFGSSCERRIAEGY